MIKGLIHEENGDFKRVLIKQQSCKICAVKTARTKKGQAGTCATSGCKVYKGEGG